MIILVGPSASGKTEVCNVLTTNYNFKKFVTSTTRPPRRGEINGIDYNFLTIDTFLKRKENNEFIETALYNDNYYGTEKKLIDDNTVLIVECNGLISFKNSKYENIVAYYLNIDEESRIKRMKDRGDTEKQISERIYHDRYKFTEDIKKYIDVTINEANMSIEEVAEFIEKDYKERIKK